MAVSYKCPNADCGVTLKTANPVPPGKRVKCPKCQQSFAPVPEEIEAKSEAAPGPGTFKFADDEEKKGKPQAGGAKPAPSAPPPPAAKSTHPDDDDEDPESVKKGYGVIQETQEEIEQAEQNKVSFGRVEDKYKKSARGPAIAMLVGPSNMLTGEGLLTAIAGLAIFVIGMWPLAFNDAPPGDEETEDAIVQMLLGCMTFFWGATICFGASQMQELGSYLWAMMGSVMGILPLLVGIYALIVLQNPLVKAGFEESEAGAEDEEEKDDDDDEDDEDED